MELAGRRKAPSRWRNPGRSVTKHRPRISQEIRPGYETVSKSLIACRTPKPRAFISRSARLIKVAQMFRLLLKHRITGIPAPHGAARNEGRNHEISDRSSPACNHGCRLRSRRRCRRRMRPRLPSWPLWRMRSQRGRGATPAGRGVPGSGGGGAARPCLPAWHGLGRWTLPLLSFLYASRQKAPFARGFLLMGWPSGCPTLTWQQEGGNPALRRTDQLRLPVTAAPVATTATPTAAVAPITSATPPPTAPSAPSPATAVAPAHRFGHKTIDLVAGRDRRFRIGVSRLQVPGERLRCKRRGFCFGTCTTDEWC